MCRPGRTVFSLMRPTNDDRHSAGNTSLGENPCSGLDDDEIPIRTCHKNNIYIFGKLIVHRPFLYKFYKHCQGNF